MTRKTTRRAAPAAKSLPFDVPPQVDRALRSAVEKVDAVRDETRTVASKVEKTVRAAATSAKKTGETLARDPKRFVEGVVRDAKSNLRPSGPTSRARPDASPTRSPAASRASSSRLSRRPSIA